MAKKKEETPLMKQYNAFKVKHPSALLLFRVGDFYETFGEDAVKASRILDIVLTKRSNGSASEIELAGFPHHALDAYLPRLVRAGQRVAICDQLEDPKQAKGIVKRGITELVTPGVSYNDNVLEVKKNNYLASLFFRKDTVGVSFLDISTGEFLVAQGDAKYVDKLMQSFQPAEVIYCRLQKDAYELAYADEFNSFKLEDWVYTDDFAYERLIQQFKTNSLKGFGIEELREGIVAAGAILYYLEVTEHHQTGHISAIARIEEERYVWMDKFTIRNLELVFPQHESGVPLIQVLDETLTPMGGRLLKKWLMLPLKSQTEIQERLDTVNQFVDNEELAQSLGDSLRLIGDIERLISKVAVGRINPRELGQLHKALVAIKPIKEMLSASGAEGTALNKLADKLNTCDYLTELIEKQLSDTPPMLMNQGGIIREGVDEELDELRSIAFSGKDYLNQIQQREVERTGISSLKIAYNKVFGYYLEVRNVHKDKVPSEWIRKQTLVNAERYITEELKVYEEKILNAESRVSEIEFNLFTRLVSEAMAFVKEVQQNALVIATVDCLLSFANVSVKNNYVKPEISDEEVLDIKAGRHPVIEQQLPLGEAYVPNDVSLNGEQQLLIITGPNMAGKSALLRQTALIVIMGQVGCFVPAKSAHIGVFDKVFTRVGASDNLSKGESTFMVEMTETASILNNLSSHSLVLMDEIGRGTSTYDGISIAWSIVEYLHNHPNYKAKTLFATHYHELNQLEEECGRVKNYNVSVKEVKNKVVFLRKLKPGGSEHSFGIHVAQIAGMPNKVVIRAAEILKQLEKDKSKDKRKASLKSVPKIDYQLNVFEAKDPHYEAVKKMMADIDINRISPVEALLKLNELKDLMGKN